MNQRTNCLFIPHPSTFILESVVIVPAMGELHKLCYNPQPARGTSEFDHDPHGFADPPGSFRHYLWRAVLSGDGRVFDPDVSGRVAGDHLSARACLD
jgi:hypothetical protein